MSKPFVHPAEKKWQRSGFPENVWGIYWILELNDGSLVSSLPPPDDKNTSMKEAVKNNEGKIKNLIINGRRGPVTMLLFKSEWSEVVRFMGLGMKKQSGEEIVAGITVFLKSDEIYHIYRNGCIDKEFKR